MKRNRNLLMIVGIGIVVALSFAYLTKGTIAKSRTFSTLATVQGAFIGIVMSYPGLTNQGRENDFSVPNAVNHSMKKAYDSALSRSGPVPITLWILPTVDGAFPTGLKVKV